MSRGLVLLLVVAFVAAAYAEESVQSQALEADAEYPGPTGRNKRTTKPYVDPHWYHRDQETTHDLYALKLCCTTYRAINKDGYEYATCNQKFYWTCAADKKCDYTLPRNVPKAPFSKRKACPQFSRKTHSGFSGPCLEECSKVEYSPELQHDNNEKIDAVRG